VQQIAFIYRLGPARHPYRSLCTLYWAQVPLLWWRSATTGAATLTPLLRTFLHALVIWKAGDGKAGDEKFTIHSAVAISRLTSTSAIRQLRRRGYLGLSRNSPEPVQSLICRLAMNVSCGKVAYETATCFVSELFGTFPL